MTYIYKTGRIELQKQVKHHAHFVKGRVLDVGAGSYPRYKGLFNFDEYVRMDVSPGNDIDIVGKIEEIPSGNAEFDSIICTQVIGDVYDLSKAFRELFRVLRPNGILLLTESLFDALHDEPNDYWRFTKHSLRRLAEDAGFAVEVVEARGGYHSVMAQMRARYWIEWLEANDKWFARGLSFVFKILGTLALFLDKKEKNRANKIFTHGYILIARKHA